MTCPNNCKNPITGRMIEPFYQGKTVRGEDMYFCPGCQKRLDRLGDVLVLSTVERAVEAKQKPKRRKR